jgi:hypothetical protein
MHTFSLQFRRAVTPSAAKSAESTASGNRSVTAQPISHGACQSRGGGLRRRHTRGLRASKNLPNIKSFFGVQTGSPLHEDVDIWLLYVRALEKCFVASARRRGKGQRLVGFVIPADDPGLFVLGAESPGPVSQSVARNTRADGA